MLREVSPEPARRASRHDLGLEHSLHSTLNTYLEKLLCLLTGNFGVEGGNALHTQFLPLIGHSKDPDEGGTTTRINGMREISKFYPPNLLPSEIDSEHPDRIRAVIVDSSNPLQSAADTGAYRRSFEKLDLLVAIDVAETETVEMADYVLPAPTQYEKWEATFFTLTFPSNYFHLRRPILEPDGDTLPEPEIYHRLLVAMGDMPARMPLLEAAARLHLRMPRLGILPAALALTMTIKPRLRKLASSVLYASLGKALPNGAAAAAVIWGASRFYANRYARQIRRAGIGSDDMSTSMLGEALFQAILEGPTAVTLSTHEYDEMWGLVRHSDGMLHLDVPEMLEELGDLSTEETTKDPDFPFVLAAGERRRWNANQIYRDPAWRRDDPEGALRIHPDDLAKLGIESGDLVVLRVIFRCDGDAHSIGRCDASRMPLRTARLWHGVSRRRVASVRPTHQ